MEKTQENIKLPNELPYNLEAEQSVLGCLLIDNELQAEIISKLNEDDFYIQAHKNIIGSLKDIILQNKAIDLITLTDRKSVV